MVSLWMWRHKLQKLSFLPVLTSFVPATLPVSTSMTTRFPVSVSAFSVNVFCFCSFFPLNKSRNVICSNCVTASLVFSFVHSKSTVLMTLCIPRVRFFCPELYDDVAVTTCFARQFSFLNQDILLFANRYRINWNIDIFFFSLALRVCSIFSLCTTALYVYRLGWYSTCQMQPPGSCMLN